VLTSEKVRCSPSSPCSRAKARCAWFRVAARLPSPPLRAVARALPGRDGKAVAPVALESWLGEAAAWIAVFRSGLSVTASIGGQSRVAPLEAGFAGDIDAFVGQHRNDPGGRGLGDSAKRGSFAISTMRLRSSSVRACDGADRIASGRWSPRVRPSFFRQAGWCADQRPPKYRRAPLPGTVGAGLGDLVNQGLAIFQAGHASSPSWKIAWSFFDSTSKAAVSASALSLRCSSAQAPCFGDALASGPRFPVSRGSPRPPIASCFQVSNSVG
jgi:hypothetical protein